MLDFHDRLKTYILDSPYDFKSLSLEIGQGERYISNMLSAKSDPGYSSVVKICSALGITPNEIAGLSDQITLTGGEIDSRIVTAQAERILTSVTREAHRKLSKRGARPLLDDVLTWWHQQGGVLSNFDRLSEHVDLYLAPETDNNLPEPVKIGHYSLAAQSFGIQTAEHLRHLFTTFDQELIERIRVYGELIGTAAIVEENEIGYRFLEKYWGQGYGQEIADGLINYAFGKLGVEKVIAFVEPENIGSVKILERTVLEFIKEYIHPDDGKLVRYYELIRKPE